MTLENKKVEFFMGERYAVINGVLQLVNIKSVTINERGIVTDYIVTLADNTEVTLDGNINMYDTEYDFRNSAVASKGCNWYNFDAESDYIIKHGWVMKDGEPQEVFARVVAVNYDPSNYKTNLILPSAYNDLTIYDTRSECLAYNDYQFKDENGNIVTRKGYAKMMQLSPEQDVLVEEFKALIEKMHNNGIHIVLDCEDGQIGMFNERGFKSICYKYEEEEDDDIYAEHTPVTWLNNKHVHYRCSDDRIYYQL